MQTRRDDHPPFRWLVDYHDGVLSPRRREQLDAYLESGCTSCEARLERIAQLTSALAAGPLGAVPPAEVERAAALVSPRTPERRAGVVIGTLLADQQLELAAAVRAVTSDTRRLLWSIGDGYEIDVRLDRKPGGADLLGQVLSSADDLLGVAGGISVFSHGVKLTTTALAPDGRFTFRALDRGAYTFQGSVNGLRFALPTVVVH